MNYLYHITSKFDYIKAKDKGFYDFCALKTDGFIHLSLKEQVLNTANKYFKGQINLVVLEIDQAKLNEKLVFENSEGGGVDDFPHLYGPLNLNSIVRVVDLVESKDGYKNVF